jgi:hypothetical protein
MGAALTHDPPRRRATRPGSWLPLWAGGRLKRQLSRDASVDDDRQRPRFLGTAKAAACMDWMGGQRCKVAPLRRGINSAVKQSVSA